MFNEKELLRFPDNGYLNHEINQSINQNNKIQNQKNHEIHRNIISEIDEITESLKKSVSFNYDISEDSDSFDERNIHQLFKNISFDENSHQENKNKEFKISVDNLKLKERFEDNTSVENLRNTKNAEVKNLNKTSNKILTIQMNRNIKLDIEAILYGITQCTSINAMKKLWDQNINIIVPIIKKISSFDSNVIKTNINSTKKYKLNTSSLPKHNIKINNLLNKNYNITNNKGQGDCLYRALADLIENNQDKFSYIKLFLIDEILKNSDLYGPLVFRGAIEIKDEYDNFIPTPKIIEFPKMIAKKGKWGNDGSFYVLSKALNLIIVIIVIHRFTGELMSIVKYIPENVKSNTPLIIINIEKTHFVAAHGTHTSFKFAKKTWFSKEIKNVNLPYVFKKQRELYNNRRDLTLNYDS